MGTKTVLVTKALATRGHSDIQDTTITICGQVPVFENLVEGAAFYEADARKLADVLEEVLPGGTFDRLVSRLLFKKAGHFRMPWKEE